MAKIFFVSPVRGISEETKKACGEYVKKLEKEGHQVHWPIRDTDQNDPALGINICDTNLKKIWQAEEIHVWYSPESTGIHFDMGAVYMLVRILNQRKKVIFANKVEFAEQITGKNTKSFFQVLNFLDKTTGGEK